MLAAAVCRAFCVLQNEDEYPEARLRRWLHRQRIRAMRPTRNRQLSRLTPSLRRKACLAFNVCFWHLADMDTAWENVCFLGVERTSPRSASSTSHANGHDRLEQRRASRTLRDRLPANLEPNLTAGSGGGKVHGERRV